jgi:hypothetical protein
MRSARQHDSLDLLQLLAFFAAICGVPEEADGTGLDPGRAGS